LGLRFLVCRSRTRRARSLVDQAHPRPSHTQTPLKRPGDQHSPANDRTEGNRPDNTSNLAQLLARALPVPSLHLTDSSPLLFYLLHLFPRASSSSLLLKHQKSYRKAISQPFVCTLRPRASILTDRISRATTFDLERPTPKGTKN
jgi:hypothetical protein